MIAHLRLQIAKLTRELYGQRSERRVQLLDQMALTFEELEVSATEDEVAAEQAVAKTTNVVAFPRKRPARQPFPEHLPRERVIEPGPTVCQCCGSPRLRKLGEDFTETLEVVPRQWKVIQHVREKFSCRDCEKISQAPAPFHVLARGWAGPSLFGRLELPCFLSGGRRQGWHGDRHAQRRIAGSGFMGSFAGVAPAAASCGRGLSVEPHQSAEVVSEIGQPDADLGADHTDSAHNEAEPAFLGGENMLDARAHPGAGGIAAGAMCRHWSASRLFPLELRLQPTAVEQRQIGRRAVGGVGPHLAGGIVAVEHGAELAAVIRCRMGDGVMAQKAERAINADMVLVAEHRHSDLDLPVVTRAEGGLARLATLDRPPPVAVDLHAPRRFPRGRHPAALDRVLLGLGQPRAGAPRSPWRR